MILAAPGPGALPVMVIPCSRAILARLLAEAGVPDGTAPLAELAGVEPALPSSFRVGAAAQAAIAASGLAAAAIWRARTGRAQRVAVDMRHAAAEFRSEQFFRHLGAPAAEVWDSIAGTYRCGDGRWVRLHTNFPHHRAGVLRLLACEAARENVAAALARWQAPDFEAAAAEAGLCVAMMRSFSEWDAHPAAQALAHLAPLVVERIGAAPPRPFTPAADRPLAGMRVLDLTRVIAGPVGGRVLAAHGAEVLHITAPHLPAIPQLVMDGGRGKLSAQLDLRDPAARAVLRGLVDGTDAMVQSYRPGALAAFGFGAEALAAQRPGIVVATLSAYGETGPWGGRRGFELAGANRHRLQFSRGRGGWHRRSKTPALPGAGPCVRVFPGARRHGGAAAAGAGGRQLAGSGDARRHRAVAARPGPAGGRVRRARSGRSGRGGSAV